MTLVALVRMAISAGRTDEVWGSLRASAESHQIGVHRAEPEEFGGFPPNVDRVGPSAEVLYVSIDDRQARRGADYLLDFLDYAPDAQIGLPPSGRDRLTLVADLVDEAVRCEAVIVCEVALTDSGEVERVVDVERASFASILIQDFSVYAPPNTLYRFAG